MRNYQAIYFETDTFIGNHFVVSDELVVSVKDEYEIIKNFEFYKNNIILVSLDYCNNHPNITPSLFPIPFVICFDEVSDFEIDLISDKAYYGYLSLPASKNQILLSVRDAYKRWENERIEKKITKEHQFFQAIIDNASIWISVVDNDFNFLVWNKAAEKITGYSKEEVLGHGDIVKWLYASEEYEQNVQQELSRIVLEKSSEPYNIEIVSKNDGIRNITLITKPIFEIDNPDKYLYTINIAIDCTDKINKEKELELRLLEKDLLLKEIHHRVKNNLQIITSLINLQVNNLQQPELRTMFKDTQDRVRSMALIHERLYKSENIAYIDIADYIQTLCNEIFRSFQVDTKKIKLTISSQSVFFDINVGIPLGLIINEVVTNSIKYAFVDYLNAEISLVLLICENNMVKLKISDNGVGLPINFNISNSTTLGMQIICNLSEQIGANLVVEVNNGTNFELLIPYELNPNVN